MHYYQIEGWTVNTPSTLLVWNKSERRWQRHEESNGYSDSFDTRREATAELPNAYDPLMSMVAVRKVEVL